MIIKYKVTRGEKTILINLVALQIKGPAFLNPIVDEETLGEKVISLEDLTKMETFSIYHCRKGI